MRRDALVCASPWHEGDLFIPSRFDAFERRIEFRRLTDQGREVVVMDRIVCRSCMRAEEAERRPPDAPRTMPLFGDD